MKRLLFGIVVGVVIGYALANRRELGTSEDDVSGVFDSVTRSPSAQRLQGVGGKIVDLASGRGADVIRRARAEMQHRLAAGSSDS